MPTEKDILKAAKGTDEFLDSSIRHHRRRLLDSIKTLENNIIDMTKEFKSSNGSLMGPRVNMKQAQKMHSKLTSLFNETYGTEARQVVKGFTSSANYIKRNFKSLDVAMDFTSVDKDMIKALKKNTWKNFNQFGLQAQEKLVDVMYNSVVGKQPFSQMVNRFRGILSGFEDVRGRSMANYADLYAHDSIMDFHNTVNLKKSDDLGFKHFLYYGSAMTTTRDFCFRRIGKVFSKEAIESWNFGWSGKSGPAMTNRGGYRCRHHWRPVRKNWIKDKSKFEADLRGEQGLPAVIAVKPSDALPAEVRAKMSPRQLRSYDSYVPSDLKSRTIAETAERKIAKGLNADHIIGKRPFDLFVDNEFIECKTFVSGRGQIRIRPSSMRKKKAFMKKYNVRGHIVAKDMRKASPTYGKLFHRAELGDWQIHTMTEVKDYDHLNKLLKKGARKYAPEQLAFKKVPKSKTIQQAEEFARKKLGIGEVGYGGVGKAPSDLLNGYMQGAIENLGVKPTRVLFDDAIFVGRNKNVAALAMEDGSLYLNRKYLGTIEKMTATAKNQFKLGQFTTNSHGHIINHEFGHLKYFHLGGTEATAHKKLTKQMVESLQKGIGPENLKRYVSKYARKNQGEFYAEMIAKQLNGEAIHPVCKKIMKDIERTLRKRQIQRVRKAFKDRGLAAKMRGSRFGGGTLGEANVLGELSIKSKKTVKGFLDSIDDLLSKNKFAAVDEAEFAGVADALGLEYRTFKATDAGKIKKGYVLGNKEFVSKRGWLKELQKVVKQTDLEDVQVAKKIAKERFKKAEAKKAVKKMSTGETKTFSKKAKKKALEKLDKINPVDVMGWEDPNGKEILSKVKLAKEEVFNFEEKLHKTWYDFKKTRRKGFTIGELEKKTFKISDLRGFQETCDKDNIKGIINNFEKITKEKDIFIVRYEGKNIIVDGYHRTNAAILLGEDTVTARFIDLDKMKSIGKRIDLEDLAIAKKKVAKKAVKTRGLAAKIVEKKVKKKVVKKAVKKVVKKVTKKVVIDEGKKGFDELKGMLTRISLMSDPTSVRFEGSDKQGIEVVKKALQYWMKFNLTRKIGLLGAKAKGKIFAVQNKLARKLGSAPSKVELEKYFDDFKVAVESEIVFEEELVSLALASAKGKSRSHLMLIDDEDVLGRVDRIIKDFNKIGVKISKGKAQKIQDALFYYVTDACYEIRGAQLGRTTAKRYINYIEDIERYIMAAPPFPKDRVVYRALKKKRKVFEKMEVGDIWNPKAISSWTSDEFIIDNFFESNKTDVIIKLQGGSSRGTAISHLGSYEYFEEQEILLSSRNKFRIVKKELTTGKDAFDKNSLLITVEYVE